MLTSSKTSRLHAGFTLIEIVVAVGLIAMLVVALVSLSSISVIGVQQARTQSSATQLAQQEMELIRAFRDKNGVEALTCTGSCFIAANLSAVQPNSESIPSGVPGVNFTRSFQVQGSTNCQNADGGTKKLVTVIVSWTDAKGTHQSNLISCFTGWQQ